MIFIVYIYKVYEVIFIKKLKTAFKVLEIF